MNGGGRGWALGIVATVALAVITDARAVEILLTNHRFIGDFTVFWTAVRMEPAQLYDAWAVTEAQRELVGGQPGLRPYVNPPSALPWIAPFGRLPFTAALVTWVVIGLVAYFLAARQYLRGPGLTLMAISPLVWISAGTGQITLLLGAALMTAVAVLPTRPILAGVLLGLAGTVKPHVVLLAPLALVAAREWRALGAALAAGAVVGLICLALQGPRLWLDWIEATHDFPALVQAQGLSRSGVTPSSITVPDWARPVVAGLGVALGVVTVWVGFARSTDRTIRLIALVAGCLLASPYGRKYDLVALQPAVVLLLLDRGRGPLAWLLGMTGIVAATQVWTVLALSLGVATGRLRKSMPPNSEAIQPVAQQRTAPTATT